MFTGDDDTTKYFESVAETLAIRLREYKQVIDEMEQFLKSQMMHVSSDMLLEVLKSQHHAFLNVTQKLAIVHDHVQILKDELQTYQVALEKPKPVVNVPLNVIAMSNVSNVHSSGIV
jgi:rRNA pseudouridine-1189 N-methylase Emg1 (Nep1/Mra1 family)